MGSIKKDKQVTKRKNLKRLVKKRRMKRRCDDDEETMDFEQFGEKMIRKLMKEADSKANVDLTKAGRRFQDAKKIRMTGDGSELEIEFQRLKIDHQERILSSPISPRTAAALEGMTSLVGNWSTMSEEAFKSNLEKGEDGEKGLSSTLKRTMLLEVTEEKKGEEGEVEGKDKFREDEAEEILENEEEENEGEPSDAPTLPTIEISDSATSEEDEKFEIWKITGQTESEGDSEDGQEIKETERLEFKTDPDLISILDLGPTEIAGQAQHSARKRINFQHMGDLEEVCEGGVVDTSVSGGAWEMRNKADKEGTKEERGRPRGRKSRQTERKTIREKNKQDLTEQRKKKKSQQESKGRIQMTPVIASPHQKRQRGAEGDWVRAEAPEGAAGETEDNHVVSDDPGKPSRSRTPKMRSLPRMNPTRMGKELPMLDLQVMKEQPTLNLFARSISAGPPVNELFPGMGASRVKPNMVMRYFIDDERMLARKEAINKILADQEEFDRAKAVRREAIKKIMADQEDLEREKETKSGAAERSTGSQRKTRTSGSNQGLYTPRRRTNRMAPIMDNSPKISEYFSKGAIKSDNEEEQRGEKSKKKENALMMTKNVANKKGRTNKIKVEEVKKEKLTESEQENKSTMATSVTSDMISMPRGLIKKEERKCESEETIKREEAKYEHEEDMYKDMKMYCSMPSVPVKLEKKEEDHGNTRVSREYFEPFYGTYFEEYSRLERKQEEEKSKQEAEEMHHEELMQIDTKNHAPEEMPTLVDMITTEKSIMEEYEQKAPEDQLAESKKGERVDHVKNSVEEYKQKEPGDQLAESEEGEKVDHEVNTVEVHPRGAI